MSEEEEVPRKVRDKIKKQVDKAFEHLVDWFTKGESLETILKTLLVEKIMNYLGPLINKPMVKTIAKKLVEKAVEIAWENNKERLNQKIESLK